MLRAGRISLVQSLLTANIQKCSSGKCCYWLQLAGHRHSAFWTDWGKKYVRKGAEKEQNNDSCSGCQEPCTSIKILKMGVFLLIENNYDFHF